MSVCSRAALAARLIVFLDASAIGTRSWYFTSSTV
jgi:hypothetical protein